MDTKELEKLFELKEKGIITEEQFNEKKKQILGFESDIESDIVDIPQLPKQGERLFNADYDKIFNSAQNVIKELNYTISNSNKNKGIIMFDTPQTWLSYGQTMLIQILKSKQSISVSIFGKCIAFQVFDWGEKKKITNKIFDYIEKNL